MRTLRVLTALTIAGALGLGALWIFSLFFSCFWNVISFPAKDGQKSTFFVQSVSGYFYAGTFSVPGHIEIALGPDIEPRMEAHPPGFSLQLERRGFSGALLRLGGDAEYSASIIFYYGLPFAIDVIGLLVVIHFWRSNHNHQLKSAHPSA